MSDQLQMGIRRFGRVNWLGTYTLAMREVRRFMAVWAQTLAAPLITAGLFLLIFSIAVGERRAEVEGQPFIVFLAPGLLMMTVIQNAFANVSSSVMGAKIGGNIVDTLMPPLAPAEILVGYMAGAVARGALIALVIGAAMLAVVGTGLAHPVWALVFVIVGSVFMGGLGLLAGIYANKFDQMGAITNFIITPLAFLSGTFYSITALPPVLEAITRLNPIFYLIDGLRFSVLGQSDASPVLALGAALAGCALVLGLGWYWLRTGYRLKS